MLSILIATAAGAQALTTTTTRAWPRSAVHSPHSRARPPLCLEKDEVISRLNAVPVFGVSNGAKQLMSTGDAETGDPVITFYLDVAEAQARLAAASAANPGADVQLMVAPLGRAFTMRPQGMSVRLQPSQAAYNGVRESLGFPGADASSAQLVPLFYSDELKFEGSPDPSGSSSSMTPFFFTVDEYRAAWVESGQDVNELPGFQLTDLRSLAYKLEHDADWRSAMLIPPEDGVAFASESRGQ